MLWKMPVPSHVLRFKASPTSNTLAAVNTISATMKKSCAKPVGHLNIGCYSRPTDKPKAHIEKVIPIIVPTTFTLGDKVDNCAWWERSRGSLKSP